MSQKKGQIYECKACDYTTMRERDFNKHLLTRKHERLRLLEQNLEKKNTKSEYHICETCGKIYKARNSLWYHKQGCGKKHNKHKKIDSLVKKIKIIEDKFKMVSEENKKLKDNFKTVVDGNNAVLEEHKKLKDNFKTVVEGSMAVLEETKKNNKTQETLLEKMDTQNKLINTFTPNISTTNNFNINIFLNEECKNAINMSDFMKSLQIQVEDLNYTNENGLIEGISSVMVNRLNQLQICERPIHCIDAKRDVLYVKDNDSWEKEDENTTVKNSITDILHKQRVAMDTWISENPDWEKTEAGKNAYLNLVRTIMSNDLDSESSKKKVIKNIAKETLIDKK
tara:strand:+ start:2159 stop:3175 length:1017 start_codon:yes stop_codon:yes gene_type:complete